jgi:hypothetical protein
VPPFEQLDFIYSPSGDVAADMEAFVTMLGAEIGFAIEAFGTRVAMVRLAPGEPPLLLAEHLEGDQPILVFRVADLTTTAEDLRGRGVDLGAPFEMPYGHGVELVNPGPQRVAVYERTRPDRGASLAGRRDF